MQKMFNLFVLILSILIFQNCTKSELNQPARNANQVKPFKDSALAWLNSQKLLFPDSKFIDSVQTEISWDGLSIENDTSHHQTILYVPVHHNGNYTGMIFEFDAESKRIIDGYYTEISSTFSNSSPEQFIANFYSHKKNTLTGEVTAYDLSHSFAWALGYKDGEYKYKKLISEKNDNGTTGNGNRETGCTSYYVVTWYSDGSSDWSFIGTVCDNCQYKRKITGSSNNLKVEACGGSGVGVGGGGGPAKIAVYNRHFSYNTHAKAVITKIQGAVSSFHANVINTGLFILANVSVNFDFDLLKKTIDPTSVKTYIEDGMVIGKWEQTSVSGVYSYGDNLYFTITGTATTTLPAWPYPIVTSYTINVNQNLTTNIVYFENISSSSQGTSHGDGQGKN